jgi:hypothetical protein
MPKNGRCVIKIVRHLFSRGAVLIPARNGTFFLSLGVSLEFAELVWSDGTKVDRRIINLTETIRFGAKTFKVPFDATKPIRNGCGSRFGIQQAMARGFSPGTPKSIGI